MSQIHSDKNSASMEYSGPEPPDPTGNGHLQLLHENPLTMEEQITLNDLLPSAPQVAEEGVLHGGDDHTALLDILEGGENGAHSEAIVDDVLAALPAPAHHHILADCRGGNLHAAI